MSAIRRKLAALVFHKSTPERCDTCVFVEFFRSNGDGQVPRLNAFCRCPGGPFDNRPVPEQRHCDHWRPATGPVKKPRVGDPTLTV